MRFCAETTTDSKESVEIVHDEGDQKTLIAKFSVPKARQMDVVDKITQQFADVVEDSIDFGASFPRSAAEERKTKKASERAKSKRKAQAKTSAPDADPHTVGLVFTGKPSELSKTQRAFLKAKNKVERLRKELADKTDTLNRLLAQHTEIVAPQLDRVTKRQKRLIEVCSLFLSGDGKPPAKTIRKKLAQCMLELFSSLFDREVQLDQRLVDLHQSLLETYYPTAADDDQDAQDEGVGAHHAEAVFNIQKGLLEEELFLETGVRFDLSGLRSDMSEDEAMAHLANLLDDHPQNPKNRKKTKRQQDKEAKEKLAAEARAKNINTVYRQLARLFHPDLEQDPELKSKKERLMKELTAAYEAGDLHTILGLELRWLQNNDGDISRLSDDKLQAYTAALEEQSTEIEAEICVLAHHPRFAPLRLDMFRSGLSYAELLRDLKNEANQTRAWAADLDICTASLERIKTQTSGSARDKALSACLRDLYPVLIDQTDEHRLDMPF
ncbi:MAG: hypothetical protein WCU90_06390 [Kiritimatiellia bacterium]